MDDKITFLINYYQAEFNSLKQSLNDCIAEHDFLGAYHFQKMVYLAEAKLKTFIHLSENIYDEKGSLRHKIARIDESLNTETKTFLTQYRDEILLKQKQQLLEQLDFAEQRPNDGNSLTVFNETLQKLITKEIKNFKLILDKRYNTHLIFSLKNKTTFKIAIPIITINGYTYLEKDTIRKLNSAGFKLINNKTLIGLLPNRSDGDVAALKTLLAKIVFEILAYGRYHESFIEYKKNSTENNK